MALPIYTCTPGDPVFEDIEIRDALDNLLTIIVATECNATWMCAAAPDFGMWGPHYPVTWRHAPPPPPEEEPTDG